MKKMHFNNLGKNKIMLLIIILSLLFIMFGSMELIQFSNPTINKRVLIIGLFLQVLYFSQLFWFKNYVRWNKKGMNFRINSYFDENSISFKNVIKSEISKNQLKIFKKNGNIIIDLSKISLEDAIKLNEIINENAKA